MNRKLLALAALVGCSWLIQSVAGCVGDEAASPPDASIDQSTGDDGGSGKANGTACGAAGECTSGQCVDGVCCESACSGTCEKCNVPGSLGTCAPVPDGQDPDNECPAAPVPDAGLPDPDASDLDAAVDADLDGAITNLPDGGAQLDQSKCAGKCNGKRACGYPDSKTTCGSVFCNSATDQGRASCDGKGGCALGLEACQAYACPVDPDSGALGAGCKASCTSEADCLPTHYCDNGTCKAKLANGTGCPGGVTQCKSGFCVNGVCCDDACTAPGGVCNQTGSVGSCRCAACDAGACKLWYRDEDNDGFGDKLGTPLPGGNGRAIPGCAFAPDGGAAQPPQAGYVGNNTDCFDGPTTAHFNVHPGQTAYFDAGYGPSTSFDYNCDGVITKEIGEYPGATCGFCRTAVKGGCAKAVNPTTCAAKLESAELACVVDRFTGNCAATQIDNAFTATVACGATGQRVDCGSCLAGTVTGTTQTATVQRCR